MNRTDSLAGYPFTAEELREVCACYAADLVRAVESAPPLDFEPSQAHRAAIQSMMDRTLQRGRRQVVLRRVAAIAAVFVILFSAIMATNVHAREAFVRWLRQVFPDHVLYQFFGEPGGDLHAYSVGYIPDGFSLILEKEDEESRTLIYKSEDATVIIQFLDMGGYDQMEYVGYDDFTLSDHTINGLPANLYKDNNSSRCNLSIFDESAGIVICIDSDAEQSIVFEIAESIR
ncbi:MAG: DUF4367 domain-containing protein [Clostridia bacterium]|nr:DUF4367 domain-containing protein [Clostridia bacterium]